MSTGFLMEGAGEKQFKNAVIPGQRQDYKIPIFRKRKIHKKREKQLKVVVQTTYCLLNSASPPISETITADATGVGEPYNEINVLEIAGERRIKFNLLKRKAKLNPIAGAIIRRIIVPQSSCFFRMPTLLKLTWAPNKINIKGDVILDK